MYKDERPNPFLSLMYSKVLVLYKSYKPVPKHHSECIQPHQMNTRNTERC
jgi:hypothetical protein